MSPCELCGWGAAFASCLAFGSFGVPIKSKAAVSVDIDPLVFQSYKTFMCFATSWIILLFGVEFSFSWWGIVSGLFWVPGGIATVYAVKSAGLAIGIGIGSSFIVLVSFFWGIFIFEEHVYSKIGASFAILCMMLGLFGMSYYSSSQTIQHGSIETTIQSDVIPATVIPDVLEDDEIVAAVNSKSQPISQDLKSVTINKRLNGGRRYEGIPSREDESLQLFEDTAGRGGLGSSGSLGLQHRSNLTHTKNCEYSLAGDLASLDKKIKTTERTLPSFCSDASSNGGNNDDELLYADESTTTIDVPQNVQPRVSSQNESFDDEHDESSRSSLVPEGQSMPQSPTTISRRGPLLVYLCRENCVARSTIILTKRQRGMLAAAFCGLWGGSILVPMKWCQDDNTKGVHYLISFAIGASVVTVALWIVRFLVYAIQCQSATIAYQQLPSFHLRVMWLPGGLSGLLWSIGNFFSLISVFYLGEGVGYPLVQTSILVSGLWGIFYFKEVTGIERTSKWLTSSLLTIFGILLLSYEHHKQ